MSNKVGSCCVIVIAIHFFLIVFVQNCLWHIFFFQLGLSSSHSLVRGWFCPETWLDAVGLIQSSVDLLRMNSVKISWFRKWREIKWFVDSNFLNNRLFHPLDWSYQVFSSQEAQKQVKSPVTGVKVQVELQVFHRGLESRSYDWRRQLWLRVKLPLYHITKCLHL